MTALTIDTTELDQPDGVVPFRTDSMFWEEMGDLRFLLVLPGALVMQVMHPAVGSAVGEFSVYRHDPWGRAVRSMDSMMLWVYGGTRGVEEGRRLRTLHKPVRGVDNHGQPYRATDLEPYAWVHGVAFERLVTLRSAFGVPLTESEEAQAYDEVLELGAILRIPSKHLPPDRAAYWEYFHDMVATRLENHPTAQDVLASMRANAIVPPLIPAPLVRLWGPFGRITGHLGHWLTVATLRPEVREILDLSWSRQDQLRFDAFAAGVRSIAPKLPERLRYHPYAQRARALEREHQRVTARATQSLERSPRVG